MNIQKTVKVINEMTKAVELEVKAREEAVMLQGKKYTHVVAQITDLFKSFMEDMGKRQAKKVIALENKAREARECLCTLQK